MAPRDDGDGPGKEGDAGQPLGTGPGEGIIRLLLGYGEPPPSIIAARRQHDIHLFLIK
jgi:hypothetical protein